MNNMETIVRKAIEGGWNQYNMEWHGCPEGITHDIEQLAFLDPLFFQSLGKACGWKGIEDVAWMDENHYNDGSVVDGYYYALWKLEKWKFYALRFHEINLTQSFDEAITYLTSLIHE